MTKRIARLALAAGAVVAFAIPAAPASAASACDGGTVPQAQIDCVKDLLTIGVGQICVPFGTYQVCVPPVSA